jgi:hypothetical protein
MTFSWVWFANFVVVFGSIGAAWRWGAGPERLCATAFLFTVAADRLYHLVVGRGTYYEAVDLGHLVIGLVTGAILFAVAYWANRIYPLALTALQLLVLLSHFTREASETVGILAYATITYAPFVLQIAILAFGILLHRRRVRRSGPYPSWRSSLRRSHTGKASESPNG